MRPALWPAALRQTQRFARDGWWHRPPFLPLADPAYIAFRLETQYGRADAHPEPADVVAYLRWSRAARAKGPLLARTAGRLPATRQRRGAREGTRAWGDP